MDYLDFIDAIEKTGIRPMSQSATIDYTSPLGKKLGDINVTPLSIKCDAVRYDSDAEYEAIRWAIDNGSWKHSWHNKIEPENYGRFLEIVQNMCIERSKELNKLFSVAVFLQNNIKETVND